MWRFDQQYLEFRSEVPWLKRKPADYIRDNFRFATQPVDQLSTQHFLQLVDMMGSDRLLMYSSDYPHFDFDSPVRVLPAGVPDDLRERILWRNAAETYGLDLA
jgi:predicted TIM-barrel fold metal-dependent hydrolase